ncbi:MAG: hypothetical protein JNK15_14645 [Planctomycetes bacterium]|nr:hypothetical protein [Planctomycetota bacterium]
MDGGLPHWSRRGATRQPTPSNDVVESVACGRSGGRPDFLSNSRIRWPWGRQTVDRELAGDRGTADSTWIRGALIAASLTAVLAMNTPIPSLLLCCLMVAGATAQVPGALLTFSQPENTVSTAGGPLQVLHPNEIAFMPLPPGCPNGPTIGKWSPRTCLHVMAGDENGDGQYWNPSLFGAIDALQVGWGFFWQTNSTAKVEPNPRAIYWSPSAAMGTVVSGSGQLRPGDVGRIHVNGTVDILMSMEQFKQALGLTGSEVIDIDAFAYEPGIGIYFSLDQDIVGNLACTPGLWVQDGDLVAIPDAVITWVGFGDYRVQSVPLNCAHVVLPEAILNWHVANSGLTDNTGAPITIAGDLESLEIFHGPGSSVGATNVCGTVPVPTFWFTTETMTGGSVASTIALGQAAMSACGQLGWQAPFIQNGSPLGIAQPLANVGPASYVNALALGTTERFVLEPLAHQLNYGLGGGPGTTVHVGGEFDYVFTWVDLAPATIAPSITVGQNLFPEWYCLGFMLWDFGVTVNGFHSFNTPTIPVLWSGKLMFQSIGFDTASNSSLLNISTPCVIDVN